LVYVSKKCLEEKQWWHRKVESISKKEKPAFFFPPSIFLKRNDFAVKQRFFISKIMDSKKIKKRERGRPYPLLQKNWWPFYNIKIKKPFFFFSFSVKN
jgi:hypothetical protein